MIVLSPIVRACHPFQKEADLSFWSNVADFFFAEFDGLKRSCESFRFYPFLRDNVHFLTAHQQRAGNADGSTRERNLSHEQSWTRESGENYWGSFFKKKNSSSIWESSLVLNSRKHNVDFPVKHQRWTPSGWFYWIFSNGDNSPLNRSNWWIYRATISKKRR